MHTLISLTKDLSVQEDRFTFPVSSNVASVSSFPFDKELKDISTPKNNDEIQPRRHDRRQNDVRTARGQEVLVDMQTQAGLRNVGTDTDSEMRDGAVPTSPVRGQRINKPNDNYATPVRTNPALRRKVGTAPPAAPRLDARKKKQTYQYSGQKRKWICV